MNSRRRLAVWIVAALVLAPVAVDAFLLSRSWRQLQARADGIAYSAMLAREQGRSARKGADRVVGLLRRSGSGIAYSIEYPLREGPFAGSPDAIRVTVRGVGSPFFSSLIGLRYPLRAEGTSAMLRRPRGCRPTFVLRVA